MSKKILFSSKWFAPYKSGKTTLPVKYYNRAGVYLIKSKQTNKIMYVGHSATSLKKTLYRHFQKWNDRQQDRFVYDKNKYMVKIYRTTPRIAPRLEKALIQKFTPPHNKNKYPSLFDQQPDLNYSEFFKQYSTEEIPF